MKIIILAAGYGTRLKKVAANTPKPLLPVKEQPLINHILERVEDLDDLTEIYVVTNNKFVSVFKEWRDGLGSKVPITIVNDGTNTPEDRLGSIGDIDFVLKNQKPKEDVLVIGGDNLFNFNIEQFVDQAKRHKRSVSIGVYDIENLAESSKFGVVELNENGRVVNFVEKPDQPKSSLIAMCFYYLPAGSFDLIDQYLADVGKADRAGDYIHWLQKKGEVYGFKFSGKWYDIGSVESYHEAQNAF